MRGRALIAMLGAALAALVAAGPATAGTPAGGGHQVVGTGTPASCTSAAVVAAVQAGGEISFDCGSSPVTIVMTQTAAVRNASGQVVIDGGGTVTLSGGGARRILYMNTCDRAEGITTPHCQQQLTPDLVVQNITLTDGVSSGDGQTGGGAIFTFGGRLSIEHATFTGDRCAPATGPDVGGGAVSAEWQDIAHPVEIVDDRFSQDVCDNGGAGGGGGAVFATQNELGITGSTFAGDSCAPTGPDVGGGAVRAYLQHAPVTVTDSVFTGDVCSNGGALSSIGASWTVQGSRFSGDQAIGHGANPPKPGTPGGGSGGAIYNDGDAMHLSILHSTLNGNSANEGGGAIFFVSDDRQGTMSIADSTLVDNPNAGFQTPGLPGIFFLGAHPPTITHSVIKP